MTRSRRAGVPGGACGPRGARVRRQRPWPVGTGAPGRARCSLGRWEPASGGRIPPFVLVVCLATRRPYRPGGGRGRRRWPLRPCRVSRRPRRGPRPQCKERASGAATKSAAAGAAHRQLRDRAAVLLDDPPYRRRLPVRRAGGVQRAVVARRRVGDGQLAGGQGLADRLGVARLGGCGARRAHGGPGLRRGRFRLRFRRSLPRRPRPRRAAIAAPAATAGAAGPAAPPPDRPPRRRLLPRSRFRHRRLLDSRDRLRRGACSTSPRPGASCAPRPPGWGCRRGRAGSVRTGCATPTPPTPWSTGTPRSTSCRPPWGTPPWPPPSKYLHARPTDSSARYLGA